MAKHTSRDAVWSEALKLAERRRGRRRGLHGDTFTPSQVAARIDEDQRPSDRTVRDVVATMADLGHLERGRSQGCYRHPDAGASAGAETTPDVDVVEDVQEDSEDRAYLEGVDTPPMTTDRETFEQAADQIVDELQTEGPLSRAEFQDRLHDDHPAGYDNERTWWRRVAKPVLKAHPDVVVPDGGNPWRMRD